MAVVLCPRHLKMEGGGDGGHSVYHCPYVHPVNGFSSLSFEKLSILDIYFIHRCNCIRKKYSSSLMWGKIHQLLWELWPLFNVMFWLKMVSAHYLLKGWMYWIHILYTGI